MGKEPRLSTQTIKVLSTLMSHPADELSGAEIAKQSRLASGTLYPILARLEDAGWLQSRWEEGDPADLGRPRRRYYKITAAGAKRVEQLVRDLTPNAEVPVWT
ncbi:PadR family transcriptional regulator [Bradyrhizobium prioriisuperbiae]|uniref:PadR family transcriptional regulator n=1 Tax=Bradyrhizobium prioriisuperbiae TaxID=2854389 RepID=UPI0028EBDCD0|nr:PadR family transcriptional regulator [Bradyrhizobium prioritasuperba]